MTGPPGSVPGPRRVRRPGGLGRLLKVGAVALVIVVAGLGLAEYLS